MKPRLSIVIVSYNVKALLLACLKSIYGQEGPHPEVFVVDNCSSDRSAEAVRDQFPLVRLIVNNNNAGFPAANNQAIVLCQGEYILLLNPDTEMPPGSIRQLLEYMDLHPGIDILAPRLLNSDGSVQFSIQPFITIGEIVLETFYLHHFLKKSKSYYNRPINGPIPVEAVSGAAMLIRKEVFNRIGVLDEELFWTEDMEFCYRAFKNDLKTVYFPQVEIVHHSGASGRKNPNVMISNQVLSKIRFFEKNHSRWEYFLAWLFRLLHILSRLILLMIPSIFVSSLRMKFNAYWFTLKRFLKGDY